MKQKTLIQFEEKEFRILCPRCKRKLNHKITEANGILLVEQKCTVCIYQKDWIENLSNKIITNE